MLGEISVKHFIFNRSALSLFLVGVVFLWQTNTACSQTQDKEDKTPLHVTSDKMIAQKEASMVEFTGNVKITRADSVVLADSVKIYFNAEDKDQTKGARDNVKKIVSTGNVRYTQGNRKAFADQAVYTTLDGILVLTGTAPKLITGSSFVTGKKITLFRGQDKVIVESDGTKRVEALFNPEDNITEKP